MRKLIKTSQFKKDFKRAKKQGRKLSELQRVLSLLIEEAELEPRHRDHSLNGNWIPCRECHIEPDWLLIYNLTHDNDLVLVRLGSHSELFR